MRINDRVKRAWDANPGRKQAPPQPKFDQALYRVNVARDNEIHLAGIEHRAQVETAQAVKDAKDAAATYEARGETARAKDALALAKFHLDAQKLRQRTPEGKRGVAALDAIKARSEALEKERQARRAKAEEQAAEQAEPDLAERVSLLEKQLWGEDE